ncbi:MAG: hotdog fold thioesterase [Candidatus Eremiobacterota bacterium]
MSSNEAAPYHERLTRFFEEEILFNRFLGLKVDHLEEGFARLRLPYRQEFLGDPFRPSLHGGVLSSLIDVAGGLAVLSRLHPGEMCHTIDMRVDYLRPGRPVDMVAHARVVRLGNRTGFAHVRVEQEDSLIAEGRTVYNLRRRRQAET